MTRWMALGAAALLSLGAAIWGWGGIDPGLKPSASAPNETAARARSDADERRERAGAAPEDPIGRIEAAAARRRLNAAPQAVAAPGESDPAAGFALLRAWPAPEESPLALGPNQIYAPYLREAARRSGLSAASLAALIDAEAAKGASGRWDPRSAHPTSSARGLAQFLESTWLGEAATRGRYLRREAESRGLVDRGGRPRGAKAEAALLELRHEPRLAIIAAAEMAAAHLRRLAAAGHAPTDDADAARLAYLAHHAGFVGARAHLSGGAPAARAAARLKANLGGERAARWLDAHDGAPSQAYAAWLEAYIAERIQPQRFRRTIR